MKPTFFAKRSSRRAPSYTDRIKYKGDLKLLELVPNYSVMMSDHRPVCATFEVNLKTQGSANRLIEYGEDVQFLDKEIDFGNVDIFETCSEYFTVRNNGLSQAIYSIDYSNAPGFIRVEQKSTCIIDPGMTKKFEVKFRVFPEMHEIGWDFAKIQNDIMKVNELESTSSDGDCIKIPIITDSGEKYIVFKSLDGNFDYSALAYLQYKPFLIIFRINF